MKLHRDLEIAQKNAWHLAHRIRETYDDGDFKFGSPAEVDETYIGGKRKNMSNAKRNNLKDTGRGAVGKSAVVGREEGLIRLSILVRIGCNSLLSGSYTRAVACLTKRRSHGAVC